MKVKFAAKTFVLLFSLCIFVSITVAQEKAQALKFDEFESSASNDFYTVNATTVAQRAERFGKQLNTVRGAKGYIIYYQARLSDYVGNYFLATRSNALLFSIISKTRLMRDDIIEVDGGYRDKSTVEFWIVPKNAEPPAPTPTLDKSETFVCPKLYVYGRTLFNEANTLLFSVSTYELKETPDFSLKWKITGGEIISDQGLTEVKVKLNNRVKRAAAFLEVSGLPYPCPKVFSATAEINGKLHLIDDFGREPNGQIKARLDAFLSVLQDNPTAQGYIINYGSRNDQGKSLARRNALIDKHLVTDRKADISRITFKDGGFREVEASELWLSFDVNQKPVPTVTVDKKFVEIYKQPIKPRARKK